MPYAYISKFVKKLTFMTDWFFLESCDCSLTEIIDKELFKNLHVRNTWDENCLLSV